MKYRVFMHVVIDARDDHHALDQAAKLGELLKNPMVRMAVGDDVQLAGGDGRPVVHTPERLAG